MAEKYRETAQILQRECIGTGICSMWLQTEHIASAAGAGQFVSIYSRDKSRLLPRPISICEARAESGLLRIVFRVAGAGTEEFFHLGAGDELELLGPLGNGFPIPSRDGAQEGKKILLVGGGIGIPPLIQLSRELKGDVRAVLGYRDEVFLENELTTKGKTFIAVEDGSRGTRGNVLDCIRENHLEADVIYACGPTPMLRALKAYAEERGIEYWLSLEEKMACGIGACLACVCRSKEVDEHSQVQNKRVCREGPVFLSTEIVI